MSRPRKARSFVSSARLDARLFRLADLVAPGLAGRIARDLWFAVPPRMAADPRCPPAARRSRSSRWGPSSGATSGAPARWSTSCTAGVAEVPSWRRSSSPCCRRGFRVVMFDAPAHGDSDPGPAGPRTHARRGVRQGPGRGLREVRPGRGRRRPLARRDLDVPDPAVRLAVHPAPGAARPDGRRGAALRPVPAGARLRRSHAAGLRPAPGGVRRDPDGGVRRDVPGRSGRPRAHAGGARPRRPPDAVRRRGTARRVACPTPAWSPPTGWATGGSSRTAPSCGRSPRSSSATTLRAGAA